MTDDRPWIERLPHDPTLQAFVSAEVARAGIEVDTLRYQHTVDRQRIATLCAALDTAHAELRTLRRRRGVPELVAPPLFDEVPDGR